MGFNLGDLIEGKWFVILGFGGALLIFGALFMKPAVDPLAMGLLGVALVAFGCGRSECMTFQQTIVDASYTPAGMGPAKIEKEMHCVTTSGAVLYTVAAASMVSASVRSAFLYMPI